jgi:hypothetical protein
MDVLLCVELAALALLPVYRLVGRARRSRRASREPLTQVFRPRELRDLEARLDEVAAVEMRRMDADLLRYVAGEVGHVVVIVDQPRHSIALALSDGHRLTLDVVSDATRMLLRHRVTRDKLRPAGLERDGSSYRLLLRSEAGADLEIHARRVALTP